MRTDAAAEHAAESPERLTACRAARRIRSGRLSSAELVDACLARVEAREETVRAWTFLDAARAREQARERDRLTAEGREAGPLHGIPVGIKDIFDTMDMPTENGSPIHAGRRPDADSRVAALLRRAGAVIMGKTVTTEFALSAPGKTRNPHDPSRTPGGSSSGSAAAVADCMVPLAIGTQTGGSVIRPASFCGVYGYKPTLGSISRQGMHVISRRLDHVGVFARSVDDLALLGDVLMQPVPEDIDVRTHPERGLADAFLAGWSGAAPRFAFVRSPVWERADAEARALHEAFADALGAPAVDLPPAFDDAQAHHATIIGGCLAAVFGELHRTRPEDLSPQIKERIERGLPLTAADYVRAVDAGDALARALDQFLGDFDAIVTPAAPGEAPPGLETTGDPVFNAMWTLCGAPAITLPLLAGPNGMPIGVQIVGRRGADAKLVQVARWLEEHAPGV